MKLIEWTAEPVDNDIVIIGENEHGQKHEQRVDKIVTVKGAPVAIRRGKVTSLELQ